MKPKFSSATIFAVSSTKFYTTKFRILPVLFWLIIACYANKSFSQNTATGFQALFSNTFGNLNSAFGYKSMYFNTLGHYNTAGGHQSLFNNINGNANAAYGLYSMYKNTSGSYNTAIGPYSLFSNLSGIQNTANGHSSLYNNTRGNNNTAMGHRALFADTTGSFNIAIGNFSLHANTTGNSNTANGYQSLYANTTGYNNTANGYQSLYSNINGYWNVASGYQSLYFDSTGNSNTAQGYQSMYFNKTGSFNTATGLKSLYSNTQGVYNTAMGYACLLTNTTGVANAALGRSALLFNLSGNYNTATGNASLVNNSKGDYNTASGYYALNNNQSGSNNTALGAFANVSAANFSNSTAIGYGAIATASNQIMLGNFSVISVKAAGSFVIMSDARFKKNIRENVPGLDFINQLKPVTYNYDLKDFNKLEIPAGGGTMEAKASQAEYSERQKTNEMAIAGKEKILYTGFVAQDVEAAAKKLQYNFSGVYTPQNDKDAYGLSYADFVVPLVKAVQQLSQLNDDKNVKIDTLQNQVKELKKEMDNLWLMVKNLTGGKLLSSSNPFPLNTVKGQVATSILEQNKPNPFTTNTSIQYNIPGSAKNAQLIITDLSGKKVKQVLLNNGRSGAANIDASTLDSGIYTYSLYADNNLIDSKKMIVSH